MFITRLKLVNFIGIQNGLGKNEIEIKFPKNGKIITMLNGANGSGKSTIMSMLTPFKESFDDRKSLIIPNHEGLKELDIEHEGHSYKIKHVYGKTTSSFFSEDGVELNENGGVRTCEDLIRTKLHLDKEYFKIGKVGSNTETFIQFTTTERKKYISSFVEAVKKYIDAYEIVNKKAKDNANQIEQISSDLKKYDEPATILIKIKEASEDIDHLNEQISDLTKAIAFEEVTIENFLKELTTIDFIHSKELLSTKESLLKKNTHINEKFKTTYSEISIDECDKKIQQLSERITQLTSDKEKELSTKENISKNRLEIENNITKFKNKLKELGNIDVDGLKNKNSILTKKKTDLETEIFNDKYSNELYKNKDKVSGYIDSFKNFMTEMIGNYTVLTEKTIDPNKSNVKLFFEPDFSTIFGEYSQTLNKTISVNRDALDNKNSEYSKKLANLDKLDILNKRPIECKIDTCPFISDALQYANLPTEIANLENIISGLRNTIDLNEKKAEEITEVKVVYSKVAQAFRSLSPRENLVYQYFVSKYGNTSIFMNIPVNTLQKNVDEIVLLSEEYLKKIDNLNEINTESDKIKFQYESALENEKVKNYFDAEYNSAMTHLNEQDSMLIESDKRISEIESELAKLILEKTDYSDYYESLTETADLETEISSLQEKIQYYEATAKNKEAHEKIKQEYIIKLDDAEKLRKEKTDELTSLKAAEITVKQLLENMTKIKESYEKTNSVKQALNPKSGIPLIFIQSYLDGTEAIANELLNIAYEGKFEIKFVPTSTDFFIQVRCGDSVIEDIKLASQGEISMTTISISLALIERSLGEYNIMYLDEIDGPLDKNNRESFISILNKQIDKLGLEQIFVISHNNAFENCSMNLVLLKGNSVDKNNDLFMKNKEIIFEAS